MPSRNRCPWLPDNKPDYTHYHDTEWGVPVRDDTRLFEMLTLEGAQAGLSWYTVLKKREGYRAAFHGFDIARCAALTDAELEKILTEGNVIRNRLKIASVRKNAQACLRIQHEFGSLSRYLWRYVADSPIINLPATLRDIPTHTALSDTISKDLKKRGMSFVGSTIIYAYMQAIGLVNDHVATCYLAPAPRS